MGYGKPRRAPPIVTLEQPWFNVKRFGAKGDGATDEQAAIQLAIDAAEAAGGGRVFIPAGDYVLESRVAPKSRVQIYGEGARTIVKPVGTGFSAFQVDGTMETPLEDITIADMTIDGIGLVDAAYTTSSKAIFIRWVKRLRILNVTAIDTPATAIGPDYLIDSLIHGCVVIRGGRQFADLGGTIGGSGIGIGTGAWENESFTISDCHTVDCGNTGILLEDQGIATRAGEMRVLGSTARGCKIGFAARSTLRATFVGCSSVDNTSHGYEVTDHSPGAPEDTLFSACQAHGNGGDGWRIAGGAKRTQLDGCISRGNTGSGVRVENAETVAIVGGDFSDNDSRGVMARFSADDIDIADASVEDNALSGVQIGADASVTFNRVKLANLRVARNGVHGVYVARPVTTLTIRGGQVYENQKHGIWVEQGARLNIDGVTAFNNGASATGFERDGMRLQGLSATKVEGRVGNCMVFDDQATKTQRYGVRTEGANIGDLLIVGNDLNDNDQGGALISTTSGADTGVVLRSNLGVADSA